MLCSHSCCQRMANPTRRPQPPTKRSSTTTTSSIFVLRVRSHPCKAAHAKACPRSAPPKKPVHTTATKQNRKRRRRPRRSRMARQVLRRCKARSLAWRRAVKKAHRLRGRHQKHHGARQWHQGEKDPCASEARCADKEERVRRRAASSSLPSARTTRC